MDNRPVSASDSIKHGLRRWLPALGAGLLQTLILLCLIILLVVPGMIWSVYYSFWMYVVALRKRAGKAALDYSQSLAQGQWWRVLGVILVIWFMDLIVGLLANIPLTLLPDNQFFEVLTNTFSNLVSAYFTVVSVIFFLNNDYLHNPVPVEQRVFIPGYEVPS